MNTAVRRILLGVVIVAIITSIYILESQRIVPEVVLEKKQNEPEYDTSGNLRAPALVGISGYLNTNEEVIGLEDYRGKVVLIDFWTYTCVNCVRTFPYLTAWDEKYREKGLVIIGVHTPEFTFEKEKENVQMAIEKYGIEYPVVQDNDYATWRAFENNFWPRKYILDKDGFIRYDHIGEGGYAETERVIQELLGEIGADVSDMEVVEDDLDLRLRTTPELYAGHAFALPRGQNIGNEGGLQPDTTTLYTLPATIERDNIYLRGEWKSNADDLELVSEEGLIVLRFLAREINIVADSALEESIRIDIALNGMILSESVAGSDVVIENFSATSVIDAPDLYNVFSSEKYIEGVLEIRVEKGFTFNAFTFG